MALTCQQNDDLLLNTTVSSRPEFNPLKTSYAFKYVKMDSSVPMLFGKIR